MKTQMKKWLAAFVAILMLWSCVPGFAEEPKTARYSFIPGEILTGKGTETVSALLSAIQFELTSWHTEDADRGSVTLISEGREAFTLRAESAHSGLFGFCCSLTGDATFQCRQDQLDDFMMTIVDMLSDMGFLKDDSLEQVRSTARRVGTMLQSVTASVSSNEPALGLNLQPYIDQLSSLASEAEVTVLDPQNAECPGATLRSVWLLREEDLTRMVDTALGKLRSVPVLGTELQSGNMRIGSQVITESFLRDLFASMHGETVFTLYQDAGEEVVLARLEIPDISSLVADETFARTRGIEFAIERTGDKNSGTWDSLTTLRLIGLEGTLLSMRRESVPGKTIDPLPTGNIRQVGDMDSAALRSLVQSMQITIAGNALNLIMDLPRVVFDLIVDRFF